MARRELALPYVPIDPNIEDSERMFDFIEAIGASDDVNAPWKVIKLLLWLGRKRPDGNLGKITNRIIAKKGGWDGDPDNYVDALVSTGWLVKTDDGYYLEGWDRHGGKLLEKRNKWRDRKNKQRGQKEESRVCPTGQSEDVTEEVAGRPDVVPVLNVNVKVKSKGKDLYREKGEISSLKNFEEAVQDFGWCIQVAPSVVIEAKKALKEGGFTKELVDYAKSLTEDQCTPKPNAKYFLRALCNERNRIAKAPSQRSRDPIAGQAPPSDWSKEQPGLVDLSDYHDQ